MRSPWTQGYFEAGASGHRALSCGGHKRPVVSKGPFLPFNLGPQLTPVRDKALVGGPWHFERAQLAAGGLLWIPRKFAMATLQFHRWVRDARGASLSLTGALAPAASRWLRPWQSLLVIPVRCLLGDEQAGTNTCV